MRPQLELLIGLALFGACGDSSPGPDAGGSSTGSTTANVAAESTSDTPRPGTETSAATGGGGTGTMGTPPTVESSGDDGAADQCGDAATRCAAQIPFWTGPVAVSSDVFPGDALECGGMYPLEAHAGSMDMVVGPHACECACDPPAALSVGCQPFTVEVYANGACAGPPLDEITLSTGCVSADFDGDSHVRIEPGGLVWIQGCIAETDGTVLEPAAFETSLIACMPLPLELPGCEADELCVADPTIPLDNTVCVYRAGDISCPDEGGYTERTVTYGDIVDTRSCLQCECGDVLGDCTNNQIGYFQSSNCSGNPVGADLDPSCSEASPINGATVASIGGNGSNLPDSWSCNPAPGTNETQGEVTTAQPVTICCQPS